MRHQFGRANRLGRRQARVPVRRIRPRLIQCAAVQHQIKPGLDPRGQPVLRRVDQRGLGVAQRHKGRAGVILPPRQTAPRGGQHFPGALHTHRVLLVNPCGGRGVQFSHQGRNPFGLNPRHRRVPHRARHLGNLRQPFGQRSEIQPCAPHNHDRPVQPRGHLAQPVAHRIRLHARHMPVQRMGTRCLIRRGRPGGQNPPVAVNLQSIGIHHNPVLRCRNFHRQSRFAAGRRPRDQHRLFPAQPLNEIAHRFPVAVGSLFRHFRREQKPG